MNVPDQIFAVGGAGKSIALEFLSADWVINDILEPRPNPHQLTVTILDTAEGEENADRQKIQDIRNRIQETKAELRETESGRVGDIDVEYKLITENLQLNGSIDLVGDDAVSRITDGNGMAKEDWWLTEDYINENLDFAKGVVRKRGLGKAIYYKAYAEDDSISTYIDLPQKGKVSIIAGLGGGTGSGTLIDLARHLQQKQRTAEITLFGVLPNHTEGIKENTNAYAALSELEYLSLTNENIFKDIVLLPIDPTGFDGKTGDTIQSSQLLEEFDEALIYLLISYYNTQNLEDPFADNPKFAPFTIGIPQILRYNVEAINEGRSALRDVIEEKRQALEAEEEVYSELERLLAEQYGAEADANLRDLDQADLEQRLEEVEDLLDLDLFSELDYKSVDIFHEIITDAEREADDIEEQIDIINGSIRAVNTGSEDSQKFVDDIDQGLAEVVETDLKLIARRKRLLEQKQFADDAQIRSTIEYLLNTEEGTVNPGVKLNQLESKVDDLTDRKSRLNNRLDEANAELEEVREEQSNQIEREVSRFRRSIESEFETVSQYDEQTIQTAINELEGSLDQFRTNIVNAQTEDEVEGVSAEPVRNAIDDLDAKLGPIDVGFSEDQKEISASLTALRRARTAFLRMNQEEGKVEQLAPWTTSTEEEREEAYKDYRMQKNQLDSKGVFSVGPAGSNFSAKLEYDAGDILATVQQENERLVEEIVAELREKLDGEQPNIIDEFKTELERGQSLNHLIDIAHEGIREDLTDTKEIEAQIEEVNADLQEVNEQIDTYESILTVFKEMSSQRDTYVNHISSFRSQREGYADEDERTVVTERDDSVYISNIKPTDVFRTTGEDDISESQLLKSGDEKRRIRNELQDLAENAREQQYTGLKRRKIAKSKSRYDDMKIRAAVLSRAIDQIPADALDFEDTFSGAFDLGGSGKRVESPYTSWKANIGGHWDIGMSVFINGVFLDNLRKVVNSDGYRDGYHQRYEDLGKDIIAHHSYALSEGKYPRRSTLLNLESDEDVDFYLRDEETVVADLLDNHYDVTSVTPSSDKEQTEDT